MRKFLSAISLLLISACCLSAQQQAPDTPGKIKRWVKGASWSCGWNVKPDKSVNKAEFARQYHLNKEVWEATFKFLADNDLSTLPIGKHTIIENRSTVTVSEYEPKPAEKGNIEAHRRYLDLQYVVSGQEMMGVAGKVEVKTPYIPARDNEFYNSTDIKYYKADPGHFFLFFPSDIHQPSVRHANEPAVKSRKIVVKIEYID